MTNPLGELNLESRYARIEGLPQTFPNQCICGRGTDTWFIDLRVDACGHGRQRKTVYLCGDCVGQIAQESGFVPVEQLNAVMIDAALLIKKCEKLEEENAKYRASMEFIAANFNLVPPSITSPSVEPVAVETTESSDPGLEVGETESVESSNEQGSTDVPNDDSSDDLEQYIRSI